MHYNPICYFITTPIRAQPELNPNRMKNLWVRLGCNSGWVQPEPDFVFCWLSLCRSSTWPNPPELHPYLAHWVLCVPCTLGIMCRTSGGCAFYLQYEVYEVNYFFTNYMLVFFVYFVGMIYYFLIVLIIFHISEPKFRPNQTELVWTDLFKRQYAVVWFVKFGNPID